MLHKFYCYSQRLVNMDVWVPLVLSIDVLDSNPTCKQEKHLAWLIAHLGST
jgi:hypothetical protein